MTAKRSTKETRKQDIDFSETDIPSGKVWWNKGHEYERSEPILVAAAEVEGVWKPRYRSVVERPTKFYKPFFFGNFETRVECENAIAQHIKQYRPDITLRPKDPKK